MTENVFKPEARDGDGDGLVQDGTKFERPEGQTQEAFEGKPSDVDVADVVEEEVAKTEGVNVITSPDPVPSEPALAPVKDGAIGSSSKKPSTKAPAKKKAVVSEEKVAVFSERNLSWSGLGKVYRGYNIVSKKDSIQWVTLGAVRLATPEEIKEEFGN